MVKDIKAQEPTHRFASMAEAMEVGKELLKQKRAAGIAREDAQAAIDQVNSPQAITKTVVEKAKKYAPDKITERIKQLSETQRRRSGYIPPYGELRGFQEKAIKHFEEGKSVLVSAPTGSGKTEIAIAAMYDGLVNRETGKIKGTIFTAPIKALSNQKLGEFISKLAKQFLNDPKIVKKINLTDVEEAGVVAHIQKRRSSSKRKFGSEDSKQRFWAKELQSSLEAKREEKAINIASKCVGLITGDDTQNYDAPIKIMTTEILDSMLMQYQKCKLSNKTLKGREKEIVDLFDKQTKAIVFDEFHYLNDEDRGHVWESCLINTPPGVQVLGLSATMGNPSEIKDWLNTKTAVGEKRLVLVEEPEEKRPVPLKWHFVDKGIKKAADFEALSLPNQANARHQLGETLRPNKKSMAVLEKLDGRLKSLQKQMMEEDAKTEADQGIGVAKDKTEKTKQAKREKAEKKVMHLQGVLPIMGMIKALQDRDKLPAIVFKFSKKACDSWTKALALSVKDNEKLFSLTTKDEKDRINAVVKAYMARHPVLENEREFVDLLQYGVAPHHAGHIPQFKALVEALFEEKLLKVAFATTTLSAGINMPAKTTVLTDLNPPVGELSISLFKQMAGRAGRPGFDTEGNVFVFVDKKAERFDHRAKKETVVNEYEEVPKMIAAPAEDIKSRMKGNLTQVLNFYAMGKVGKEMMRRFIDKSLASYQEEAKPNNPEEVSESETIRLKENFDAMKRMLERMEYIDDKGNLTPKGQIASRFKFNNPVYITELLYKLDGVGKEKNQKAIDQGGQLELHDAIAAMQKHNRLDNFAGIMSLVSSNQGMDNYHYEKATENLKRIAMMHEWSPAAMQAISETVGEIRSELNDVFSDVDEMHPVDGNLPSVDARGFYGNMNWTTNSIKGLYIDYAKINAAKKKIALKETPEDERKKLRGFIKKEMDKPIFKAILAQKFGTKRVAGLDDEEQLEKRVEARAQQRTGKRKASGEKKKSKKSKGQDPSLEGIFAGDALNLIRSTIKMLKSIEDACQVRDKHGPVFSDSFKKLVTDTKRMMDVGIVKERSYDLAV